MRRRDRREGYTGRVLATVFDTGYKEVVSFL